MAKKLKYKVGDKVIYTHGVGGYNPTKMKGTILFAQKLRGQKLPPYIISTAKFDTFSLERDLKLSKTV